MIGPWSELYLYNPDTAYHSDRLNPPRPFLDQVKSTLDRYMELELPKARGSDFDAQWYRPFSTPIGLISDLIALLLILLALYGSILLFHPGFAEQADQPVASMAKAHVLGKSCRAAAGSNATSTTRTRRPIMDPIFRVICDVAGLVTRGSDAARLETRRMAAERERRAAVEQPITAATPASERSPALPYKWLKIAFRSF